MDDDETFRKMLCKLVQGLGHEVVEAANGAEAIVESEKQGINLLLTDLLMPGKDGFEIIRHVRKRSPTMKIIAMSGGGRIDAALYLDMAEQIGAWHTLIKPFSKGELEAVINDVLGESRSGPRS